MFSAAFMRLTAPFGLVLGLSATRPVFTADLYVIDGGSGKVRAVVDWNDNAHWLDQSNTTLQCALPAAHADFAGMLCLTFTGTQWYASTRATSYWEPWHRTGAATVGSLTPTEVSSTYYLCGTFNSTAPGFGMAWNVDWVALVRSTGTTNAVVAGSAPDPVLNVPVQYRFSFTDGSSPEYRIKVTGASEVTGNGGAPGSGASESTLHLGSRGGGAGLAKMRQRHLLMGPDTAAFRDGGSAYIQQDTGIAA